MGISPVGPKLTRRIARETGLEIDRAVGNGSYEFGFRVLDASNPRGHFHGFWNKATGEWEIAVEGTFTHWLTCLDIAPGPTRPSAG